MCVEDPFQGVWCMGAGIRGKSRQWESWAVGGRTMGGGGGAAGGGGMGGGPGGGVLHRRW